MAFSIVHPMNTQVIDVPIEDSDTIFVGAIVSRDYSLSNTGGVEPLIVADGRGSFSTPNIPLGVCIGTNLAAPLYSAAQLTEYITDSTPFASTADLQGVEGPWAKGDRVHMAKIAVIDCTTVLRGPIRNNSIKVAPSVLTSTTGSGSGISVTVNSGDVTPVAGYTTIYCRTGLNQGAYRTVDTAHATTHEWDKPMVKTCATVGETYVVINGLNTFGLSKAYIDSEGLYIDCSAALTADYLLLDVLRLDLSVPGDEYVEFRFNVENFAPGLRLELDTT